MLQIISNGKTIGLDGNCIRKETKTMKVKQWIQKHKREIIVGTLAACGTAAYFLIKDKKIKGLKAGVQLSLDLINGDEDADFYGFRSKMMYIQI